MFLRYFNMNQGWIIGAVIFPEWADKCAAHQPWIWEILPGRQREIPRISIDEYPSSTLTSILKRQQRRRQRRRRRRRWRRCAFRRHDEDRLVFANSQTMHEEFTTSRRSIVNSGVSANYHDTLPTRVDYAILKQLSCRRAQRNREAESMGKMV